MPVPAISNQRHTVFRLSMRASVHDIILKVCEHNTVKPLIEAGSRINAGSRIKAGGQGKLY